MPKNVLGTELEICCRDPMTGWRRNGRCETGRDDFGRHLVCARMTAEFLEFTAARGNDLSSPRPEFGFPGLKPGDCWCLCVDRWREAHAAGVAPPVKLAATHMSTIEFVSLDVLRAHALDESGA